MSATQIPKFETPMLEFLHSKGVDFSARGHSYYRLQHCKVESAHSNHTCEHGIMDLIVETFFDTEKLPDRMTISVCHYGLQNGDLMKDPEIVYSWDMDSVIETPRNFYNDYTGTYQEVFPIVDGTQMIVPKLLRDLKDFTGTWVKNLKSQGQEMIVKEVEKE